MVAPILYRLRTTGQVLLGALLGQALLDHGCVSIYAPPFMPYYDRPIAVVEPSIEFVGPRWGLAQPTGRPVGGLLGQALLDHGWVSKLARPN